MEPDGERALEAGDVSPVSKHVALSEERPYLGPELTAHFLRSTFGLHGDAVAAWVGPVRVGIDALVDLEDREAGAFIAGDRMLHVVAELYDWSLLSMVGLQRLMASRVADLTRQAARGEVGAIRRQGDDVYVGDGKLTVSIATASVTSSLLHFGVNVGPGGAPVPIACLDELGIELAPFARSLVDEVAAEIEDMRAARAKVRAVGEWDPSKA